MLMLEQSIRLVVQPCCATLSSRVLALPLAIYLTGISIALNSFSGTPALLILALLS